MTAQTPKIDSLKYEISVSKYDSTKIRLLNDLGIQYWNVDLDKSIKLGFRALQLADKSGHLLQKARSYNLIGVANFRKGELESAYNYYKQSIKISERFKLYEDLEKSLVNCAILYASGLTLKTSEIKDILDETNALARIRGMNYKSAMVYYGIEGRSLSYSKDNFDMISYLDNLNIEKDTFLKPIINITKAFHFRITGNYFRALECANITLKLSQNELFIMAAYEILTEVNFALRRFKDAETNSIEVIRIIKGSKDPAISTKLTLNEYMLGTIFIYLKKYKEAYTLLYKNLFENMVPYNKAGYYCNMAIVYLNLDSLNMAKNLVEKSIQMSDSFKIYPQLLASLNTKCEILKKQQQYSQLPIVIEQIEQNIGNVQEWYSVFEGYALLTEFYKSKKNYSKALICSQKLLQINDSIKNKELNQLLDEFQTKYETEKKEQQILLQQSELKFKTRLLVISISAGALVLIALILIAFLYNKRNQAYKRLVYQSINCPNESLILATETSDDSEEIAYTLNENDIKPQQLSDEQKAQILVNLKQQIDLKVYLQSDLNINKLAELCNTNRTYLSLFINETYRTNFNTYINKLRIDEAKRLLLERKNELQLKNLSTELGFNTYNVFNEAFKKHIGVTPAFFVRTINEN